MKTSQAVSKLFTVALLMTLISCTSGVKNTNSSNSQTSSQTNSRANPNDPKLIFDVSPTPTPVAPEVDQSNQPAWSERYKYYYLLIGNLAYHGTKGSESELITCAGKKIPIATGKLVPTTAPCNDYNLQGRKVSEDDEREAEFENEACAASGSDNVGQQDKPGAADVIDLVTAIKEELIEAEPEGTDVGQQYMKLKLSLKVNAPVYVRIPAGTIFLPEERVTTEQTQRMISTVMVVKRLEHPGQEVCISVPVACLDIELKVPAAGQSFSAAGISALPQSGAITKLVNSPDFRREGWTIQQAAVWIVRSNPQKNHRYFAAMPYEMLLRVRTLIWQAGIPTENYQIFNELKS
jgi:hypothetical protein